MILLLATGLQTNVMLPWTPLTLLYYGIYGLFVMIWSLIISTGLVCTRSGGWLCKLFSQVVSTVQRGDAAGGDLFLQSHCVSPAGACSAILEMKKTLELAAGSSFSPATPELGSLLAEAVSGGCSSLCISDELLSCRSILHAAPKGSLPAPLIHLKLQAMLGCYSYAPVRVSAEHRI